MIVTQITEMSKSRSKVYLDQEFAFVLYKGELRLYHLKEGEEVSKKDYEEIVHKLLPKRAKLRAMNLLQKRAYTEKQLRDKLQEGLYAPEILEEAIMYVKSFHYINDEQYAIDYFSCYEDRKSLKKMEMELLQKGISKDIIRDAIAKWQENGGQSDELEQIEKLLKKKHYHPDCEEKEKYKIYAFLLRKGYTLEKIQEAMR